MDTLLKDLKHAFRMLRQSPGFTATAISALALGIGANTAIFSVVNTVLLEAAALSPAGPHRAADERYAAGQFPAAPPFPSTTSGARRLRYWRTWRRTIAAGRASISAGGDRPEQVKGIHVSYEFFHLFGAPVALGRTFPAEEDRPRGGNVVVLSNGLWQRRFGSDPDVDRQSPHAGGEAYTIIGVLAPGFSFDPPAPISTCHSRPTPTARNRPTIFTRRGASEAGRQPGSRQGRL